MAYTKYAEFTPAWWLPSPHLQTLWPVFFRKRDLPPLSRERFELPDGDFIDLAWGENPARPVVLVVHGLEGSLNSHYAGLLRLLQAEGYCPVFMHFRGCSGEPNRLARSYHSGDTGDLKAVVSHISEVTGKPVFAAVGFSLGGNALLKWLGQSGSGNPVSRAVAVSVPFVLSDAADRLSRGVSRLYERHLLRSLRQSYRTKFSRIASPLDVDVESLNGFREFDDRITAPLHGFRDVDHYYGDSSCRQYLKSIRTATRIIHAEDDPFMYPRSVPGESELSASVELLLAKQGGHVGFISGKLPWKPVYWHEAKIMEFLNNTRIE